MLQELRFHFLHPPGTWVRLGADNRLQVPAAYPVELEQTLLAALRHGREEETRTLYQDFFSAVSASTFTHFRFSMKRLFISIQLLVKELHGTAGILVTPEALAETELRDFEHQIDHLGSRAELDDFFEERFATVFTHLQVQRQRRLENVAEQVRSMIEQDYANPNVCLQYLADAVKLSSSYAAKIFKESYGMSVGDYCLQVRMSHAAELLTHSELPVKEIALAVGYQNENYVYTLFRKHTGVTPVEFRKKQGLQ